MRRFTLDALGLPRDVLRLVMGHLCLHAAMTGARMAAPLLALSSGYGTGAAGVLVALFAVTQIFLSLPAGRYADRRGLKRPLGWAVVAATVAIGAAAAWPEFPVLCVTALVCGGAVGAALIALQRHLGRAASGPVERMRMFTWLSIAPAAANFLGTMTTGLLIDHYGYRSAFLLLAFLPSVAWLFARRTHEIPPEPRGAGPSGSALELLRDRHTRRILALSVLMSSSWDLHTFMVPVIGFARGIDAAGIGFVLGIFGLAAAGIRFVMAAVAARIPEWKMLTIGIGVAGVTLLVYPWTGSIATMACCSAVMGMALGSIQPNILSLLHDATPSHRHGEALAVRHISVNVTSLVMPMLLGASAGLLGASGVFWAMGLVVTAGSRLGVTLRPEGGRSRDH
ncbi:MAG: MFS transporter [Burkholderiales bacterium]